MRINSERSDTTEHRAHVRFSQWLCDVSVDGIKDKGDIIYERVTQAQTAEVSRETLINESRKDIDGIQQHTHNHMAAHTITQHTAHTLAGARVLTDSIHRSVGGA